MTDATEASPNADNLAEPLSPLVPDFPIVTGISSQSAPAVAPPPAVDSRRSTAENARRIARRHVVEWVVVVIFAVLVAAGLRTFSLQAFFVTSGSMLPTLQIGDRIVVIKFGYTIQRGDIVVFKRPPKDTGTQDKDLVKRVIGLPGETISSRGNTVLINGRPIREPWLPRLSGLCAESAENIPITKIPEGDYFVMGDCRGDSADSRVWGTLPGSLVVGRVFVIVWRFGHPYFHWF